MKKTILCYGDSNTHGYIPETGRRHPIDVRWTGILQQELESKARVIEEGLNGRTTIYDEPLRPGRNGEAYLAVTLESHSPIDIIVLMLGTNDIFKFAEVKAQDAARGVSKLIDLIHSTSKNLDYPVPKILLVSPPLALPLPKEEQKLCPGDPLESHKFGLYYQAIAKDHNCMYLDAAKIVDPSEIDSVHLDADNHHKLGIAIANALAEHI